MSLFNPKANIAEQYRSGRLDRGVIYGADGRQVAGPKPFEWYADPVLEYFKQAAIEARVEALRRSVEEERTIAESRRPRVGVAIKAIEPLRYAYPPITGQTVH